jgi:glycine/D-amino acid oxidase-like deaminating enzyme
LRARALPADDATCGWWEALPPPPEPRRLAGEVRVATAVVGAGFTGLAAARRLAELAPGDEVAVIDAQRAGYGASGRSSGFVVDLASFVAALADPDADRFIALSRRGIALLREAVERFGIDCDWDDRGWLHVARSEAGLSSLAALRSWLDRRGEAHEPLDEGGMERAVGTSYYRAGLRLPGSVLVQPAALVRGLAAALPEPVALYEETPVTALRPGSPVVLETPGGRVVADRVLVATNGLMPALGLLRARLFPLWTFGSLTRPLTAEEQAALGGDREWGVLAQDVLGSSLRRTRDQRLLVRNSVRFTRRAGLSPAAAGAEGAHRRALAARFPALAEIPFDHTWGGIMGMSANGRHHFGPVGDNLWAAAGYNAAGIALGTISGHLLAEAALAHPSPDLEAMRSLPRPSRFPPPPLADLGIRWRISCMERASGGEP